MKPNSKKKSKAGQNAGKKYDKPLSLHPMQFDEAVTVLLKAKPKKKHDK